jgi:hypothetical protein
VSSPADAYWRFASVRLGQYHDRAGWSYPYPYDPVVAGWRFTNTFRASDRVSQELIAVQLAVPDPADRVLATVLFRLFNRPATWYHLAARTDVTAGGYDPTAARAVLDDLARSGASLYGSAYIIPPAPYYGAYPKHAGHVVMARRMVDRGLPDAVARGGIREAYEQLVRYPGVGRFMAYQLAVDLGYAGVLADDDEDEFVVPGPGCVDGARKCFPDVRPAGLPALIRRMVDEQEYHLARLGLPFPGLHGRRRLHLVDAQGLFCEVSKYSRVAFPDVRGNDGRVRVKFTYSPDPRPLPTSRYPPHWGLPGIISSRTTI